ncbi:DUF4347 domain-containing protein [Alphaproteobacteria bacterium KMM 3653]|uniref:DUF4347 domain-containing protein n=1 Tax=Harenicola maris TaxID=2841044 RepID=A0AAP2G3R6_9RHOB|nr:DUF4347 domain-containing protein [Harenicola maris]
MRITAVDGRDSVGWLTRKLVVGEITFTSTQDLIDGVKAKAKKNRLSELHIFDHGTSHSFQLGDDWIRMSNYEEYWNEFMDLGDLFRENGFMVLHNCSVGNAEELIKEVASLMGVTIYASRKLGSFVPWVRLSRVHMHNPVSGGDTVGNPFSALSSGEWTRFDANLEPVHDVTVPSHHRVTKQQEWDADPANWMFQPKF